MSKVSIRSSNPEFDSLVPNMPFNRRAFVITMLGAGFALATQPVMAETVIKTSTDGLVAGEIKVPVSDGEMVAYRAQPAKGSQFSGDPGDFRDLRGARTYRRYLPAPGQARLPGHRPGTVCTPGRSAQDQQYPGDPRHHRFQSAGCTGHDRSRCLRVLGQGPWRRCVTHGDHRLLLGWPHHLAIRCP